MNKKKKERLQKYSELKEKYDEERFYFGVGDGLNYHDLILMLEQDEFIRSIIFKIAKTETKSPGIYNKQGEVDSTSEKDIGEFANSSPYHQFETKRQSIIDLE